MRRALALLTRLGQFAHSIPTVGYVFALSVTVVSAGAWWHAHAVDTAFERGRQDVISQAKLDSAVLEFAIAAQVMARSRTDTVVRFITRQTARVDSAAIAASVLARRVPVALDSVPEVRALKAAVFRTEYTVRALTDSIPKLLQSIDTERATARMTQDILGAELTAAKIIIVAKNDTIAALQKRPTWGTVGKVSAGVVVVVEIGRAIVQAVRK
jgi:hypothetical protein